MSATLDRTIGQFFDAIGDTSLPSLTGGDPNQVRVAVKRAIISPNPRGTLNLEIARLKARKATLRDLRSWLNDPSICTLASRHGASNARRLCIRAIDDMLKGRKAHLAFGMGKAGHPHNFGFSLAENLAAYVESRVRSGDRVGSIMADIRKCLKSRSPEERVIRSIRAKIRPMSDVDLAAMADVTRRMLLLP